MAEGGGSKDDAKRWVTRWSKAAQHPVTAHSLLGEKESIVDVRFTGERATMSLLLEDNGYDDGYGVVLGEND
ncbi:hypothetical protein ABZS61_15960 [Streptomyces sp. NPDC005566]|uniref:hypothetical protein n=1 Tax=Streptomyces sp. NPDC005566 TaxID=3156886 RepID=UPI0033BA4F59